MASLARNSVRPVPNMDVEPAISRIRGIHLPMFFWIFAKLRVLNQSPALFGTRRSQTRSYHPGRPRRAYHFAQNAMKAASGSRGASVIQFRHSFSMW